MSSSSNQSLREARLKLVEKHCMAENDHDLGAIMETFGAAPSFGLNGADFNGREVVEGLYAGFGFGSQGSFSGIHLDIADRHVNDETIILELFLNGRHTGDWNGLAPTGREFRVPLCAIFKFDDEGKLASERVYFDTGTLLQQLGVRST